MAEEMEVGQTKGRLSDGACCLPLMDLLHVIALQSGAAVLHLLEGVRGLGLEVGKILGGEQ